MLYSNYLFNHFGFDFPQLVALPRYAAPKIHPAYRKENLYFLKRYYHELNLPLILLAYLAMYRHALAALCLFAFAAEPAAVFVPAAMTVAPSAQSAPDHYH